MGLLKKLFGKKNVNVREREGNPNVYDMADEKMSWAIEKAQLTFHYFKDCLAQPKEGQQYFSIKARIEDGEKVEHIWLTEPSLDSEGNVYGIVGNEPIDVKTVAINEQIGIPFQKVSDWMIIENGRLIGGYTIRAIRNELSPQEQVEFDKTLGGLTVDDGEDYFLTNFETPEGAILSLEEAYDNDDIEKAIASKSFEKEAETMLRNKFGNEMEIDDEMITSMADVLRMSFEQHMQETGMPKFDGIKRAFQREFVTDDECIITETCYYPDGGYSKEKLRTYKTNTGWKVGTIVED